MATIDEMDEPLAAAQLEQLARLAAHEERGETVGGWKLGLTSGASRDAFGPGVRPFGYVLASRVLNSGAALWWDDDIKTGAIENEVCFVLAVDVTEPVTAADMPGLLAGLAPAFEINQVRIDATASNAERLVDNLSNWGIVVGDVVPVPDAWDQAKLKVGLLHNADGVESVLAADHIDDHFESLATLANRLLRFGRRLSAGDRVITGAFGRAREPRRGLWSGDFGEFGRVHVRIER